MKHNFITGTLQAEGMTISQVATTLGFRDYLGNIRVRLGIKRDKYRVDPGIYAIGVPGRNSDVFVTANYKLSFDSLRKNLAGLSGWILVLDTRGINVWCAAGKGNFGTRELAGRIDQVNLAGIVDHRRLILPQLSATGVSAHKVKEMTGFNVHYGPIRASDIQEFLHRGYRADSAMRKITFNLGDRAKLIPNDFMYGKYYLLGAMGLLSLISWVTHRGIFFSEFQQYGTPAIINTFLAYTSGIVLTPILLPYIPGRFFSVKGFLAGAAVFLILLLFRLTGNNVFETVSWFFIITAVSSFLAMNFTGSSTFTSLSGVKAETRKSLPVQIASAAIGLVLFVIGKLI